jgi:Transposase DDE domain
MTRSLQRELNDFYGVVQGSDYSIQAVTKGALTQSRAKLRPEAFLEMNQTAAETFYEQAPWVQWKTHRLLGIDGSGLILPDHASVREEFGVHQMGRDGGVARSMAKVSICYDVLNLLTLDARMHKYATAEQPLLKEHLEVVAFRKGDILLLDRNYPSVALLYELQQRGLGFCVRLKDNWWKAAVEMKEKGELDKEVVFELPRKDLGLMEKFGSREKAVRCRLVAVGLDNGETEILCTSLLDKRIYSYEDIRELYHYRWSIEEGYKLYKCRAGLELFSGKTATAVKQDFYAKVFMMTMCALLSFPIEQKVRQETAAAQHPRKINRTNAIAFCREAWPVLWIKKVFRPPLEALDKILQKTTEIIRPRRKYPRKHNRKHPPPMNYKQL